MAVYYINTYDITDMEEFQNYPPKVRPLLAKYKAEVIAMDMQPICLEGEARMMNALLRIQNTNMLLIQ